MHFMNKKSKIRLRIVSGLSIFDHFMPKDVLILFIDKQFNPVI